MGRLPAQYAGRDIRYRVPYAMPGEVIVAAQQIGVQFPDSQFQNAVDKPFEIHRMIPRLTALDVNKAFVTQPDDGTLEKLHRLRIADAGKNESLVKNAALIETLTKGTSERTWEFADPYYITNGEAGLVVTVDSICPTGTAVNTRVEVTFQGFLIVVAPPNQR